jgi:hypothetical protein
LFQVSVQADGPNPAAHTCPGIAPLHLAKGFPADATPGGRIQLAVSPTLALDPEPLTEALKHTCLMLRHANHTRHDSLYNAILTNIFGNVLNNDQLKVSSPNHCRNSADRSAFRHDIRG